MCKQVYIALGGNIGDTESFFSLAKQQLEAQGIKVLASSTSIITKAYGYQAQADFLNAVICVQTILEPLELLKTLKSIEQRLGRLKTRHWGERCIDLDIIFYEELVYTTAELIIPHPDLQNRDFVLLPMLELAPDKVHPVLKKTIKELYQQLKSEDNSE